MKRTVLPAVALLLFLIGCSEIVEEETVLYPKDQALIGTWECIMEVSYKETNDEVYVDTTYYTDEQVRPVMEISEERFNGSVTWTTVDDEIYSGLENSGEQYPSWEFKDRYSFSNDTLTLVHIFNVLTEELIGTPYVSQWVKSEE